MHGIHQKIIEVYRLKDGFSIKLECGHSEKQKYEPALGDSAQCQRCLMRERDRDRRRKGSW